MTRTLAHSLETMDLVLDREGNIAIVSDLEAVAANCQTAVQAQRGEMMFEADKGMPTFATAWNDYNPVQFEAAARTIIQAVPGVLSVGSFAILRVGEALRYTAVIRTVYGETQVNG